MEELFCLFIYFFIYKAYNSRQFEDMNWLYLRWVSELMHHLISCNWLHQFSIPRWSLLVLADVFHPHQANFATGFSRSKFNLGLDFQESLLNLNLSCEGLDSSADWS